MALVNIDECEAAGLDPAKVLRIAKGLSRYAKEAEALGLQIFGGTGEGSLRFNDSGHGDLVVADLDGNFSGGDGSACEDADGLIRGEY